MYRRCLALLSAAEAQDAVQEVFLRAFQSVRGPPGSPLAWLYTIANHYCHDVARRSHTRGSVMGQLLHRGEVEPTAETGLFCRAVLGAVDVRTCEIAVLHFLEGLTQEEVAQRTGLSRKTVGKRLRVVEELFRAHEGATP